MRLLRPLALAALVLTVAACDTASTDAPAGADATTDTETAAASIAQAVALNGGGVLDEAASAALASVPGAATAQSNPPSFERPGCERTRTFDEAATLWTVVLACERGRPDGRFYTQIARTVTVQFLAGGQPQQAPDGADALAYDIVSGTALRQTPHATYRVTDVTASLDVTDFDEELVTVNGTYARAGADSLRAFGNERVAVYTLDLTATDLRGPRRRHAGWRDAVSGSVSGVYRATVTVERRNGTTVTREVERTFTVTFTGDGDAEIAVGGRRFRADADTGEVAGLDA